MSNLNLFQRFVDDQAVRAKLQLPNSISAILDYCEYSVRTDFNSREKTQIRAKNRKNELAKEFTAAFGTLSREQKIEYFCLIVGYIRTFAEGNFNPPKSQLTGVLNGIGFSRSFNIKRWKEKKLRLDLDKHLMFAEREQKIKSYDMRNYILRRSKNKDYHSFVLEAINNIPPQKSMTVHIGFTEQSKLNEWTRAIKWCVDYRQWEFFATLYKAAGMGIQKSMSSRMFTTDDILMKKNDQFAVRKNTMDPKYEKDEEDPMSVSMVVQSDQRPFEKPTQSFIKEEYVLKGLQQRSGPEKSSQKKEVSAEQKQKFQEQRIRAIERAKEQKQQIKEKQKLQEQIRVYQTKIQVGKTLVDQLIQGDHFEEPDVFEDKIEEENEQAKQIKKHLDLFHKLNPQYELEQLEIYTNFTLVQQSQNLKIYQHSLLQRRLKLVLIFDRAKYNREQVLAAISKPETSHIYNDNIESSQLKTYIPSENSALMYLVNKPYNRLYRARDFVFIRHVFSEGNKLYMIDKSIENTNYPPFMTIVRGTLCVVYGIFQRNDKIELIADFQVQNEGLLNPVQETNLTLKYLKGFTKLPQIDIPVDSYKLFQLDWDISKNQANKIQNQIRFRRRTINMIDRHIESEHKAEEQQYENRNFSKKQPRNEKTQVIQIQQSPEKGRSIQSESPQKFKKQEIAKPREVRISSNKDNNNSTGQHQSKQSSSLSPVRKNDSLSPQKQSPQYKKNDSVIKKIEVKRFDQKTMEEVGQITGQDSRIKPIFHQTVVRQLDSEGMVIINKNFLKTKYIIEPLQNSQVRLMEPFNGHPIWRGEWIHDDKEGGIIFIHKKKIQDQKGVLKFILSKIAKNLLSGQSITQISLPVDIFGPESNLQRFLFSMTYAPLLLQKLQKENLITRLVRTVIFGISNSILYLSMEKPFNPILGETFQCWINGCPAYAEQISHHPPIGALLFKGRGYDITAQLESKVSLGVNSGTGTNEGIYRVKFADRVEICFVAPGGEISGLTAGDRKFNVTGKSYYWITDTNIMVQISFDPFKKGFFSVGKQQKPSDYFEGTVWEVKPQFMAKFLAGKRKQPDQKDRVKDYGKFSGIWNQYVSFNGAEVWSWDRQYPVILDYEANPLPSDANWREDIEYRRKNEVTRAQIEKERLEVLQRKDRKFRQKYHKKK